MCLCEVTIEKLTKWAVQHLHFSDQFELFLVLFMSQLAFGKGTSILNWQGDSFHL